MAVDDAYTKSLLHFDGANNGTTFTDESGKTWTASGTAKLSTAQQKFGNASALFDASAACYVSTPDATDWNVGSGDWTMDMWVKKAANGTLYRVTGKSDSAATASTRYIEIQLQDDNTVTVVVYYTGSYKSATWSGSLDTNWHHIAAVRYGNVLTVYVDGTAGATTGNMTGITVQDNAGYAFTLGALGLYTGALYSGYIDEFRFTKGIARWTANFTPPTLPYGYMVGTPVASTPFMMI